MGYFKIFKCILQFPKEVSLALSKLQKFLWGYLSIPGVSNTLGLMWTFAAMEWPAEVSSVSNTYVALVVVGSDWQQLEFFNLNFIKKNFFLINILENNVYFFPLVLVKHGFPHVQVGRTFGKCCLFLIVLENLKPY